MKRNSLVMYKRRPARVIAAGERLTLELPGETVRVRPKDVVVLHPGPAEEVPVPAPEPVEPALVWEILDGACLPLPALAELAFGEYTPSTAAAVWRWVEDGTHFSGIPGQLRPSSVEAVQARRQAAQRREQREQEWQALIAGVREGRAPHRHALADVERLALGQATGSRVLQALGQPQTPWAAHALLLSLGLWDEQVNPYPARHGVGSLTREEACPASPATGRIDLTALPALAIDGEATQYPDDALSLEPCGQGWTLWVHVADVAALVPAGSALDLAARTRGATLYLPEASSPLLPDAVSRAAALGLGEVSPALSVAVTLDPDFQPLGSALHLSWVRVTRLTYREAQRRLEGGDPLLACLAALASARRTRREAAGATLLTLPRVRVTVRGGRVEVTPQETLTAHRVVEEAMLFAGWAAARWAAARDLALPFAAQPPARAEVAGTGLGAQWARRRALGRTSVQFAPAPHHGMGLDVYARVTSPLRRYTDLLAHQQLRAALLEERPLSGRDLYSRVLQAEAGAGAVRAAQREAERHWTLVYLLQNPGWTGTGEVVQARKGRSTLLIPGLALEHHLRQYLPEGTRVRLGRPAVDLPGLGAAFELQAVEGPSALLNAAD